MKKLFRYSFLDENNAYYYIDNNGDVSTTHTPTYLYEDPKDWANTVASFTRNGDAHGLMRKSSSPLLFHGDSAKIIRSIYYSSLSDGYCKLVIDKQNRDFVTNNLDYAHWFSCEVDFGRSIDSDMDISNGDVYVSLTLMELGLAAILENKKEDVYEIPFFESWSTHTRDPDAKEIEIGDIRINNQYEWIVPETKDINGNPTSRTNFLCLVDALNVTAENEVFNVGTPLDEIYGVSGYENIWEWGAESDIVFNINFTFQYHNNSASIPIRAQLFRGYEDRAGVNHGETLIYTDPNGDLPPSTTRTIDVSLTDSISYLQDMKVYYMIRFTTMPINPTFRFTRDSRITMEATYSMPSSRCYGFLYKDLLQKIINRMSGGAIYTVVSDLLDISGMEYFCRATHCLVTSSSTLRNLDDPKIKTSFNEIIKDLQVMFGAGWSVEGNTLRVEVANYFFNKDLTSLVINQNSTVQKTTATGYVYNRIKIGFNDTAVDEVNGLQEFCGEQEYSCGIKSPAMAEQELNLISPFIHGLYSIENIRAYIYRSNTISTPTDNDTCVIEYNIISDDVHFPAKTGFNGTTFISGVKYTSDIYNTGHSPKACLLRNFNMIKSYLRDGQIVEFNSATKNSDVIYGDVSIEIQERSGLEVTQDGAKVPSTSIEYDPIDRIFYPYIFEYKGEVPENLVALMDSTVSGDFRKYGIIKINDNGIELDMFILDVGVTPATNDVYQIRGLCATTTDLTKLIR